MRRQGRRLWAVAAAVLLLLGGCGERRPLSRGEEAPSQEAGLPPEEEASSLPSSSTEEEPAQEADPLAAFSREDWQLILVNAQHPLEEELAVELEPVYGYQFDRRAAEALQAMVDGGTAAGFQVQLVDTYRSFAASQANLDRRIRQLVEEDGCTQEEARAIAVRWIAPPGQSEHNTGLAVDLVTVEYRQANQLLNHNFEEDPFFSWLIAHCADYGFILRYPKDKEEITGITYEPWHYRYVGEEAARYIMDHGLCLEEFWELLPS